MTCATVRDRLGELVTDALDADERAAVERHVRDCRACRAELDAIRGVEDRLRSLGPARRKPSRTAALWRVAAAALLFAAGVTALLWPQRAPSLVSGSVALAGETISQGARLPRGDAVTALAPSAIRLPGGSLVFAEKGARLAFGEDRRVRLDSGEAHFAVAKAAAQFEVETPRGRIEVKGTRFTVRVEGAEMGAMNVGKVSAAAAGVAVVVAAGVVVYRDYVTDDTARLEAGMEAIARDRAVETRRQSKDETDRLSADLAQTKKRIADLERTVAALEASSAGNGETLTRILEEQQRLAARTEKPAVPVPPATSAVRAAAGDNPAQAVGDLLHLDPGRQSEFERVYEDIARRMRDAESVHATATTSADGVTTTIQIERFAESGAALAAEWKDWLARSLSADERARYDKYKLVRTLFPRYPDWRPFGGLERTVRIDRTPNGVSIVETGVAPDGSNFSTSNSYSGGDVEKSLAPYRHLMK